MFHVAVKIMIIYISVDSISFKHPYRRKTSPGRGPLLSQPCFTCELTTLPSLLSSFHDLHNT